MKSSRLTFAIAASLTLVLASCGKSPSQSAAEMAVAAATGGKVQISKSGDQSQVSIKTEQGEMKVNSGDNVPLPKDFPSDIHLPGTYTVKSAVQMGPSMILEMHTPATVQAVYSDYDSSMKSGGWKEAMAMQTSANESMLSFQKDNRTVVVSITAASNVDGSDVHLQSTSEQE